MSRGSYQGMFSGWSYPSARALGYAPFSPDVQKRELAEAIIAVFNLYRPQGLLPIGPRGCGYRLEHQIIAGRTVVKGNEFKGRGAAQALRDHHGGPVWTFTDIDEVMVALRRASRLRGSEWALVGHRLNWDDVDDGRTIVRAPMVAHDLIEALRSDAEAYSADLLADQPMAVELWIEAQGGFGLWTNIAHRWGVPVYSGSGMNPADAAHAAAERWTKEADRHPEMLIVLVTDCDPAGYIIADRFAEDSSTFVQQYGNKVDVGFVRLALSERQVNDSQQDPDERKRIEWGPEKRSHGRYMPQTAEAEAMLPEVARDLFDDLMERYLDQNLIETTRAAWQQQVDDAQGRLAS